MIRKPIKAVVTSVACLSVLLAGAAYAQKPQLDFFNGLFHQDEDMRLITHAKAIDERNAKVQELISIVQMKDINKLDTGPLVSAIHLLGVYRAPEAIRPLVERLAFLPVLTSGHLGQRQAREMYYPSVQALLKIGMPSETVELLRYKISGSDDRKARELAAWLIMKFQGKEQTLTALQEDAKYEQSETRERILSTIEYVKAFKQESGPPEELLQNIQLGLQKRDADFQQQPRGE